MNDYKIYNKFQYSVNKKVRDILNWFEKDMYKIPYVDYKGDRIYYYAELNADAIEVHYKAYDIKTKECTGSHIQFSFVVDEFDEQTSVITCNLMTHDSDVEKLAYTYLLNLGTVLNAEWKAEVLQHLDPESLQSSKPKKPKQPKFQLRSISGMLDLIAFRESERQHGRTFPWTGNPFGSLGRVDIETADNIALKYNEEIKARWSERKYDATPFVEILLVDYPHLREKWNELKAKYKD